ncbi:uncharacterized protein ACRADG_004214 [Cochliomyia hominivorax]
MQLLVARQFEHIENMEVKQSIQYYLYENQSQTTDIVMVEENKLLKQLQEAVHNSKNDHSEDELTAAVAMMLMHYQAIDTEPDSTPKNKFAIQIEEQKEEQLESNLNITNDHATAAPSQDNSIDTIRQQIRRNRRSNYSRSALLASCRNILKEFLSQNSL